MLSYPQQIELLNLKERIVNNPALRQRLMQMLGQSKGWREFSEELGCGCSIVRHLKEMALSELYYSTRDFTAMRAEVFNEEKEDMLRHPKRKAVIILNSPNAVVELTTISRKPITRRHPRPSRSHTTRTCQYIYSATWKNWYVPANA